MSKLTEEQIKKAVNWWAKAIGDPKFSGLSDEERKDPGNKGYELAEILAMSLARDVTIAIEQFEDFKSALANALRKNHYKPYFGLHTDYHPDRTLGDAADRAGITSVVFPWKTNMWFDKDGRVSVRYGYSAPIKYL